MMENESCSVRETRTRKDPGFQQGFQQGASEYSKGRKISLNPSSYGSAQMGGKQDLPPFETLRDKCDRVGHLKKLCGRGLLSAGTWKDRTCILYQNQLFLYEKQATETEKGNNSTGLILDLGTLDIVREAPTRVTRKAANVFLLGYSEKGTFFDTTSSRHYFAAKTLGEMKEWVSVLNSCMESERTRKKCASSKPTSGPNTPQLSIHYGHKDLNPEDFKMASAGVINTLPRSSIVEAQLDCGVSKSRVRGPPGRRLPRSKKSMDALLDAADQPESPIIQFRDNRGRATSLSALEYSKEVSVDLRPEPRRREEKYYGGRSYRKSNQEGFKSKRTVDDSGFLYTSSEDDKDNEAKASINIRNQPITHAHAPTAPPRYPERADDTPVESTRQMAVPQAKTGTPSSFKLLRKNIQGVRGGTPVRYSASMTPPPCVLRKLRQEETAARQKQNLDTREDGNWTFVRGEQTCHSSTSSLSTLTDEHVIHNSKYRGHNDPNWENFQLRQNCRAVANPYDSCSSLKRKSTSRNGHTPLQNSCKVDRVQSVTSSPLTNGKCFHTLERRIDDSSHIADKFRHSEPNTTDTEILNLRSSIEILKDKVNHLTSPQTNAARQISGTMQEINALRDDALKVCEYAKNAQYNLDKLTKETEGLLEFLRRIVSYQSQKNCSCSQVSNQIGPSPYNTMPNRKGTSASPGPCKKNDPDRSLECIVETPSYVSDIFVHAQKQDHHRRRCRKSGEDSESSDQTSSDNETKTAKSVLCKGHYHKS